MAENTAVRWTLAILAALAIVAMLAYARGDDSDDGRSPEPGDSLPALVHHAGASAAAGA